VKRTVTTEKASANIPVSGQTGVDQALIKSELRYRRLFESAQDGILILNAETGLINDVNPYLIDMLGYSREEFVEKKLWEVGAFKDIEASRNSFLALQKNEFIRYENLPLRTKGGRLVQVEFVSNVYLVGDNPSCGEHLCGDRQLGCAPVRPSLPRLLVRGKGSRTRPVAGGNAL